jgi:hypothetical protein
MSKGGLLKVLADIRRDEDVVKAFGSPVDGGHLGDGDESLYRIWEWQYPTFTLYTVDEGNGYCRVLQYEEVEREE